MLTVGMIDLTSCSREEKKDAADGVQNAQEKVEDAGFFVASLTASVRFNNAELTNDSHIEIGGTTFHFLNIKDQTVDGDKTIRVLDKGYVTAKAFKQNSKYTTMECYKTGKASACCGKDGVKEGTRIYHVTI